MLAGTAGAEVVDRRTQISERAGNVGPDIGALSLFHPRSQHLHRGFVGMDDALFQHDVPQRIDQRLQLHAAAADPLRQGRARDGQASAAEDLFLTVQRQISSSAKGGVKFRIWCTMFACKRADSSMLSKSILPFGKHLTFKRLSGPRSPFAKCMSPMRHCSAE
ncbi:hypothetical protein D3C78_237170 [compost metagenome]